MESVLDYELRKGLNLFAAASAVSETSIDWATKSLTPIYYVSLNYAINKYVLNSLVNPIIYIRKGETVQFLTDSTTAGEPLRIMTSPNSSSSMVEYTEGVVITNNGVGTGGRLLFTPPLSAPRQLWYGSGNTWNFGNMIIII